MGEQEEGKSEVRGVPCSLGYKGELYILLNLHCWWGFSSLSSLFYLVNILNIISQLCLVYAVFLRGYYGV